MGKDELGLVHKETMAKLERLDADLRLQVNAVDMKRKDLESVLDVAVTEHRGDQDQLWTTMKEVRSNLRDLEVITSKHESEVAALQTATGVLPDRDKNRFDLLEEEADLSGKRHLRVEKVLGLEPLTKDNADDAKVKRKKRASTMVLGEDQLLRLAWTAWMEGMGEEKQNRILEMVPKLQEMIKMHNGMIESEKSKLHSTNDRVQSLEEDHTKLLDELQTLRKSLDIERSHWQGMTRGLQEAKKTMRTEGDGAMLPNAMRLRNALPLTRPNTTQRPLSSLVSPLPSSS